MFVQYKNTSICLDFYCRCGQEGHYDGYFANELKCGACGTVFAMPFNIDLEEHGVLPGNIYEHRPTANPVDVDMDENTIGEGQ